MIRPLDDADVRAQLEKLAGHGIQALAVSLINSFADPAPERGPGRYGPVPEAEPLEDLHEAQHQQRRRNDAAHDDRRLFRKQHNVDAERQGNHTLDQGHPESGMRPGDDLSSRDIAHGTALLSLITCASLRETVCRRGTPGYGAAHPAMVAKRPHFPDAAQAR